MPRMAQVDLIAELKRRQVSPVMREGKDGTIEDIITGQGWKSHPSLELAFTSDFVKKKNATLQRPDCAFFPLFMSFPFSCSFLLRLGAYIFWIFLLHCLVSLHLSLEGCSFRRSFRETLVSTALWCHLQWLESFVVFFLCFALSPVVSLPYDAFY